MSINKYVMHQMMLDIRRCRLPCTNWTDIFLMYPSVERIILQCPIKSREIFFGVLPTFPIFGNTFQLDPLADMCSDKHPFPYRMSYYHALNSQYRYQYWPVIFSINILNIGRQYWQYRQYQPQHRPIL